MIRHSRIDLKERVLGRLQSLAEESGEPIETVIAKAIDAYQSHHVGKEDQEGLRALAKVVEAYKRDRVGKKSQDALSGLAGHLRQPQCEVLAIGLRERLLDLANAAYRDLKADPEAWEREQRERTAWDTLLDGLEDG